MNDVVVLDDQSRSLKKLGTISYLLHAFVAVGAVIPGVQASVALLVVAFVLDLVKRDDAVGTWQESHFRWRIRSVVIAGLLYAVTAPLWVLLIVPGAVAWFAVSVWLLYRIVRGWVNLQANKPMPMPAPV